MTLIGGVVIPSEVLNYMKRTQRLFSLDTIVRGKAAQKLALSTMSRQQILAGGDLAASKYQ